MNLAERVEPFYFGKPDRLLFGCYHEPAFDGRFRCAVVICQPVGHEYINCHRALRQLATRLCDAGFPVLRFDYYGCGDSAGQSEEGSIAQWREDTMTAVSVARQRTGAPQICLLGLRLGGALAMMAAAEQGDLESIVLWDPVLNGRRYLEGLRCLQKEALRFRRKPNYGWKFARTIEAFGFIWPPSLCADLEGIDLQANARKLAKNVLVVQTDGQANEELSDQLQPTDACVEFQRPEAPPIWLPTADGGLLVPGRLLQGLVSWISRTQT
ncbi:MAG TPA: alpha/beta fold hydrolase [Candidatus Acidoferrum sp.]|nr:alpha/beta fold hydrolase [Candidatus Acidoferrum sp.]